MSWIHITGLATGCHCLCPTTHPRVPGICTGSADGHLGFRVGVDLEELGLADVEDRVYVPMCSACMVATLAQRPLETPA